MDAINYAGMQTTANPAGSFGQGYQTGAAIQSFRAQQEAAYLAKQQAEEMQKDVSTVLSNPNATAKDYAGLQLKYPKLGEQFKAAWSTINDAQKESKLDTYTKVHAAALTGNPEQAIQILQESVDAHRNSGDEAGAKNDEHWLNAFKNNPQAARALSGVALSAITGPEKYASTFAGLGAEQRAIDKFPAELRSSEAKAVTDEVAAKNAPAVTAADLAIKENQAITSGAAADLAQENAAADLLIKANQVKTTTAAANVADEKEQLSLDKTRFDMEDKKEERRIQAIKANLDRETNELKRQELQQKLTDAQTARDEKKVARVAEGENALASIDNTLQTIDAIKNHPGLSKAVGWQSGLPTIPGTDAADLEATVETLQSQSFLSQINQFKGMGALSDAEGKKLNAAISNLSIKQSEESFKKSLNVIQDTMEKARERAVAKYGLAGSQAAEGATVVENHPKYGTVTERKLKHLAKDAGVDIETARDFLQGSK